MRLRVPGMRNEIDPWLFAMLMGVAAAGVTHLALVKMRRWPLQRWAQEIDDRIDDMKARAVAPPVPGEPEAGRIALPPKPPPPPAPWSAAR